MENISLMDLLTSWQRAMRGNRSDATIATYTDGVTTFVRWCATGGSSVSELSRDNVQQFITDMLDGGAEPATALTRLKSLKQFAKWLTEEGEIDANPLLGISNPTQHRKVIEPLTDEQLKALIKACQGKGITDRRDEAIVRLMAETGMRAAEVVALQTADVNLDRGIVVIRNGKGSKGRTIGGLSPQTIAALDRYLRARRTRHHEGDNLWVGARAYRFGYQGLDASLRQRARAARINGFHLHLLRHTAANRWLRKGGSEQGLMAVAGWSTRSMLDRYTGASASERAAEEARKLGLGDL